MKNEFTAIIERDGEWSIVYCPEIPGANGQGRTKEEARESLAHASSLQSALEIPMLLSRNLRARTRGQALIIFRGRLFPSRCRPNGVVGENITLTSDGRLLVAVRPGSLGPCSDRDDQGRPNGGFYDYTLFNPA